MMTREGKAPLFTCMAFIHAVITHNFNPLRRARPHKSHEGYPIDACQLPRVAITGKRWQDVC